MTMLSGSIVTDRAAWLEERKKGVGASEAAAALGLSPWESPRELYLRKLGLLPPVEQNDAMEEGLHMEALIARKYQEITGRKIVEQQVSLPRSEEHPLSATLDGVTSEGRPVEFKWVTRWDTSQLGEEGTDELPEHWLIQGHAQMVKANRYEMDFAVKLAGRAVRIYPVVRDEDLVECVLRGVKEFWGWVERREVPPLDTRVDRKLMHVLYPGCEGEVTLNEEDAHLVRLYEKLGEYKRDYAKDREEVVANLLDRMKGAAIGYLPDGRQIVRRVVEVKERTQTVAAHSYARIWIKKGTSA